MIPREKADELIRKYYKWGLHKDGQSLSWLEAKQCAMIAVDEVLNVLPQQEYLEDRGEYSENRERIYWKEVKQEIEKL